MGNLIFTKIILNIFGNIRFDILSNIWVCKNGIEQMFLPISEMLLIGLSMIQLSWLL